MPSYRELVKSFLVPALGCRWYSVLFRFKVLLIDLEEATQLDNAAQSRYELEFPDLFALLAEPHRSALIGSLDSDRLEGGTVTREGISLLVRCITENLSDEEFTAEVLALISKTHPSHGMDK